MMRGRKVDLLLSQQHSHLDLMVSQSPSLADLQSVVVVVEVADVAQRDLMFVTGSTISEAENSSAYLVLEYFTPGDSRHIDAITSTDMTNRADGSYEGGAIITSSATLCRLEAESGDITCAWPPGPSRTTRTSFQAVGPRLEGDTTNVEACLRGASKPGSTLPTSALIRQPTSKSRSHSQAEEMLQGVKNGRNYHGLAGITKMDRRNREGISDMLEVQRAAPETRQDRGEWGKIA